MRFLVVGELNPDLILCDYRSFPALGQEVLVEDLALMLGSASAICAVGLARLGNTVRMASKVGTDQWGDFCVHALTDAGVDTSFVKRDPRSKTGLTVSITGSKDRALVTYLGAIATFQAADVDARAADGCGHLHVSSYFLQQGLQQDCRALFAAAHARGLTTSLDPGFDPSEKWAGGLRETLGETDVFFPVRTVGKIGFPGVVLPNRRRALLSSLFLCCHFAHAQIIAFEIQTHSGSPLALVNYTPRTLRIEDDRRQFLTVRNESDRAAIAVVFQEIGRAHV